jgi:hypothetical protein
MKGGIFLQEDIENRTIVLIVSVGRLTARTLERACSKALYEMETKKQTHDSSPTKGRQSVKELISQDVATNSLPITGQTRNFDRVAKKFNVDYAFHKTGKNQFLLFFKSSQKDAITQCFSEYAKRCMKKGKHRSIHADLERGTQKVAEQTKQAPERVRTKEVLYDR